MEHEALMRAAQGYRESAVILAAVEIGLFDRAWPSGGETRNDLSATLGCDPRALGTLLDALTALEILAKHEDRYTLPEATARSLDPQNPGSLLFMLRHQVRTARRWNRLAEVLRSGHPISETEAPDPGGRQAFIDAMHFRAIKDADKLAEAVLTGSERNILDIGGASGSYTIAFLRRLPQARATLTDLPPVIEMARQRLTEEKLLDRVTLTGGNMLDDPPPPGHDLALLSAIVHMFSRAENQRLFANVLAALSPGGRLIIRDHVMDPDHTHPATGAMFAINMLVGTPGGGCYSMEEFTEDLILCGFERVRLIRTGTQGDGLVEAFRPIV